MGSHHFLGVGHGPLFDLDDVVVADPEEVERRSAEQLLQAMTGLREGDELVVKRRPRYLGGGWTLTYRPRETHEEARR